MTFLQNCHWQCTKMILTNLLGWFSLGVHSELLVLGWTDLFEQDLFDLKREASYKTISDDWPPQKSTCLPKRDHFKRKFPLPTINFSESLLLFGWPKSWKNKNTQWWRASVCVVLLPPYLNKTQVRSIRSASLWVLCHQCWQRSTCAWTYWTRTFE